MDKNHDLIVVGGGAAGLSAAQYGARANLRTLLFEEMAPGGQALLIDRLENYPGLADPVSGYDFAELLRKQAAGFGAEILSSSVSALSGQGGAFELETDEGSFGARAVIIATGAKHRLLGVPGEAEFSGRGVSYCATCDGPFFKGRRILVVGGGDAACDEASFLAQLSDTVTIVHRRGRFRAQKALAERVLRNPHIAVRFNTGVVEIKGGQKVESAVLAPTGADGRILPGASAREEAFDAVFVFVGSVPQTALIPGAQKDEAGFVVTDERRMTSIPGVFAAGDLVSKPFRQVVTACADGAVAAHSASQYLDELAGAAYR